MGGFVAVTQRGCQRWAVMLPWAYGAWRTVSVTSRPLRPEGKTFSQTSISLEKFIFQWRTRRHTGRYLS